MDTLSVNYTLYGKTLDTICRYTGGKEISPHVRLYCLCKNVAHANRICGSYKLGKDIFSNQNSMIVSNEKIIELIKRYTLMIQIKSTNEFIPAEILKKEERTKINRP